MSVVTRILPFRRADFHERIEKPRGADDLLRVVIRNRKFVLRGRGGNKNRLSHSRIELRKRKRSVVVSRLQSETEIDEVLLSRPVAVIHRADLRNGHMTFVDESYEILREIIEKSERRIAGFSAVEIPAVILNAAAIADFAHHFYIVTRALQKPLRLEQFILFFESLHLFAHVRFDTL